MLVNMKRNLPLSTVHFIVNLLYLRYFYDSAGHCFDHCVKTFDAKELSANEKGCVNICFSKQTVIYGNLLKATQAAKR